MEIDVRELAHALLWFNSHGYTSGDESVRKKKFDGSTSIRLKYGDWTCLDVWDGGEPFGGCIRVSYQGQRVWRMSYQGEVHPNTAEACVAPLYHFLLVVLRHMPLEAPFRGPRFYRDGLWRYENWCQGDIRSFAGIEKIYHGTLQEYTGRFFGGLVNQR
jgi:uncharacterized protein DUF5680